MKDAASDQDVAAKVRQFVEVAQRLDVTPAQLALAWTASNPHVSTVITGASSVAQVTENMGALVALERLDDQAKTEVETIFA